MTPTVGAPGPARRATRASPSPTVVRPRAGTASTTWTTAAWRWLIQATGCPAQRSSRSRLARRSCPSPSTWSPRLRPPLPSGAAEAPPEPPPARVVKPPRAPGPRSAPRSSGTSAEEVGDVEVLLAPAAHRLLVEDPRHLQRPPLLGRSGVHRLRFALRLALGGGGLGSLLCGGRGDRLGGAGGAVERHRGLRRGGGAPLLRRRGGGRVGLGVVEAGGDDRDPDLVAEGVVDD